MTLSTLVDAAPDSLTPLLNGSDGWTDEGMAEFEEGVELALLEEVNSWSTSVPSFPRHSVDLPLDKINSQEYTETTGSRPEELQDASRHAPGLKEWEQQGIKEVALQARRPQCLQSPPTTSLKIDRTLPKADHGYPTMSAENERHCALRISQSPVATEECLDAREDEDGSDDSIDEDNPEDGDYAHNMGDEEEEDTRPAKRRKSSLPPSDEVPTHRHPLASILNEQLHTPRPSRSPSARTLELAAGYREWPFQGCLKV